MKKQYDNIQKDVSLNEKNEKNEKNENGCIW